MMSSLVLAKAALNHDQIKTKLNIGCDGIEVQLLGELLGKGGEHDWLKTSDVFNLDEFRDYPIKAVHAPLIPGKDDTLLERVLDKSDYRLIYEVFKIANYFGELHKEEVKIIFHSEMYKEFLEDLGDQWDRMVYYIDFLLKEFPYTQLLIENVSPLRGIGKGKQLHLANNCMFDNIEMVKDLRDRIGTYRIGTVLDTCHQMLTEKYVGAMYDLVGDVLKPDLSLENFFRLNQPYVELIHLCDMRGSGYGKGRHGIPFSEDTYNKLVEILSLKDRWVKDCTMTLEVEETDFSVCDGFRKTKELVERYCNLW